MHTVLAILLSFVLCGTAAAQQTGDIYVGLPDGQTGRVYLNGKDTGQDAPTTLKGIPDGEHRIQVQGHCTIASEEVFLLPGNVERVELTPTPMGGFVEIEVSPASAKVFLDQRPIGNGPNLGLEVDCGRHVFSFRALQYVSVERTVEIEMGNVERLQVRLQQAGTGSISVQVDPVEAEVFLDGRKVAVGHTTLPDVPEGSHLIGAMLDGYIPLEQRVRVRSGERSRVELTLKPEAEVVGPHEEHAEPVVSDVEPVTEPQHKEPDSTKEEETSPLTENVITLYQDRRPSRLGRQIAGGSLLGVSALSAWLSWRSWNDVTMVRYSNYVEKNRDATYYEAQVRPAQAVSVGLGLAAGCALFGGSALLYYDDNAAGFHFNGRF